MRVFMSTISGINGPYCISFTWHKSYIIRTCIGAIYDRSHVLLLKINLRFIFAALIYLTLAK